MRDYVIVVYYVAKLLIELIEHKNNRPGLDNQAVIFYNLTVKGQPLFTVVSLLYFIALFDSFVNAGDCEDRKVDFKQTLA